MKKAFTLIEFIFVIIVIGIIATIALPNLNKNNLPKAAHQVVEHIRYTQHLAIVDDKFDSETALIAGIEKGNWFNKRWRIIFQSSNGTDNQWSYSVFDDRIGDSSGNVDQSEIAVNPLNKSKLLSGGATGTSIVIGTDAEVTDELNIGKEYGILDVDFSANCRTSSSSKTIAFDYLGRPLRGALSDYLSAYDSAVGANLLILSQCIISLCTVDDCTAANNDEIINIAIEPETGYVHIIP